MKLGIPQVLIIVIYVLSLGIALAKDGQHREDKYSFGSSFLMTAIIFALLYWGKFFE